MIKITSLGGSGEDSRSCFLVETPDTALLFDCGVRREIADVSRVYPLLTREIAAKLDAVFLSHAHEDHTAALPYLTALGYDGPVYASAETIADTPAFLRKWADYVIQNGGSLPFAEKDIDSIRFVPLEECPIKVSCGRGGHIIGGLWFRMELEGHSLLYTGDLTYDSLLLEADPLPKADILIIDSAYAGRHLNQKAQYEKLAETALDVTKAGGKLLLPVPANGRGIDMFIYLSCFGLPLFTEHNILKNAASLIQKLSWIKDFDLPLEKTYTIVDNSNRSRILSDMKPGVYLFGDGMMTTPISREYFEAIKDDERSKVIISGHTSRGTLANQLLQPAFIEENNIKASTESLTIKVHNDFDDIIRLAEEVRAGYMVLFQCKKENCLSLAEKLTEKGIEVLCDVGKEMIIP